MILAISIGNTHVAVGTGAGGPIRAVRYRSESFSTQEDCAKTLQEAMRRLAMFPGPIAGSILSSVNPRLTPLFSEAAEKVLGCRPVAVGPALNMALDLSAYDGERIGSDRIAVCEAAVAGFSLPAVVFDFGTATTVNVVDEARRFLGGAILPGLSMGLAALAKDTAQLPYAAPLSPVPLIGRDTRECLIAGAVFGNAAMLDGMAGRIEARLGSRLTVLVTGGAAAEVIPHCETRVLYEPELLLTGLCALFEKNRKQTAGRCLLQR